MNARRRRTPTAAAAVTPRHRGFTLLELMVTIGIIAILISILVPVVIHARKAAATNRTKQNLEAIRTALDAYKSDWGMYPPIAPLPASPNSASDPTSNINNTDGRPMLMYDGAHALYTALMLRGNARMSRTSNGSAAVVGGSRSYGPYLQAEQVKSMSDPVDPAKTLVTNNQHCLLCDAYGNPILYIPAYPLPLNYTTTAAKAATSPYVDSGTKPNAGLGNHPYYDFDTVPAQIPPPADTPTSPPGPPFHNATYSNGGMDEMRVMLGDTDHNGVINANATTPEQAAATGPYLLWTAGPDGRFGINASSQKSDDICNFDFAPQYRE
jgi:prepilin-type N-terminal cleavage/methylation domain-containing protein